MSRILLLAMLAWGGVAAQGHRVDEYLQATRLGLSTNEVTLELDLTPGTLTTPQILPLIDLNRDGQVLPAEEAAYAQSVLDALTLKDNGRGLTFVLLAKEFPAADQMKEGLGTIRLTAKATLQPPTGGKHRLYYRNDHQTNLSVYLANAFLPPPGIVITHQRRDELQREFEIEGLWAEAIQPTPEQSRLKLWLGLGLVALCGAGFHRLTASKTKKV